jgi:sulfate transport system ATP-binding protein
MSIDVQRVSKTIGRTKILDDISLTVEPGELVALLGPSGSGKTTLLRIIAGLETADSGRILFEGSDTTNIAARDRHVGFVFQHYALFRHMSVFENVAFGLRVKPRKERPSEEKIQERVNELLSLVQLDWLAHRMPSQLSGGQRQRIALARALAVEPRVLLLDEPFGALDAQVRKELRRWLRKLHDDIHITSVFVTHDQEEAMEVADRIVVMNHGRIEQAGSPEAVYAAPATRFVFSFLGAVNLFHGRIHQGAAHVAGEVFDAPEFADARDTAGVALVRPHDINVVRTRSKEESPEAIVRDVRRIGPLGRVTVEVSGSNDVVEVDLHGDQVDALQLRMGDRVFLEPRKARVFPADRTAA